MTDPKCINSDPTPFANLPEPQRGSDPPVVTVSYIEFFCVHRCRNWFPSQLAGAVCWVGGLVSPLFRPDSHPSQFGTSPLYAAGAGRVKLEFEMSPINGVRRSTPILRRACSTKIVGIRYASSVSILTEVTITNLNLILNQINLTGIFPPIVTPFNPDESIAWDKLRGNLARWPLRAFSDRMMKSLLIQMEAGAAERLPGPRQQRGVCLPHRQGEGRGHPGGQGGGVP